MNLFDLIIPTAFAQGAATSTFSDSGLNNLVPLVVLFVIFYFLLIRPQQKRAKAHKSLLAALKSGDEVVTNGGVVGRIVSVDESFVTVEIAKDVVITVQKQGINQKLPKGSSKI